MKKLFTFLLLGLFMISFASAMEIDNWVLYENNDKTAVVKNSFNLPLLTEELARLDLLTPLDGNLVAPGKNVSVMEYWLEYDTSKYYSEMMGEIEVLNMITGELENKTYYIQYAEIENISEPNYDNILVGTYTNGTQKYEYKQVGSHIVEKEIWYDVDPKKVLPSGIKLRMITDVELGDHYDGVWTVHGKKIKKHAAWLASLNTGLRSFYYMDETSGTNAEDQLNAYNGTISGTTIGVTGINGKAFDFTADTNNVTWDSASQITSGETMYSFWIKTTTAIDDKILWSDSGAADWGRQIKINGPTIEYNQYDGGYNCGGNGAFISDGVINDGNWHHIAIGTGNGNCELYIDGVLNKSIGTGVSTSRSGTGKGGLGGHGGWTGGIMTLDLFGIWTRGFTQAEVTNLYNNGTPVLINGTGISSPTITLNSPVDTFNSTETTIQFNYTVTDDIKVDNVTLYINDTIVEVDFSGTNGTYITSKPVPDGNHNWSVLAYNNNSLSTQSETRTFTVDTAGPVIVLSLNETEVTAPGDLIILNTTITDPNLDQCWYNYNNSNTTIAGCLTGVINQTEITTVAGQTNITVYANDTLGQETSELINFSFDTTKPVITVESPTGVINYGLVGVNETLNVTFIDTSLDTCWYNYNGTNITIDGCLNGIKNSTLFIIEDDNTNMTLYANDTIGNINSTTIQWGYKLLENSQIFNNATTEGATETFTINFTKTSLLQVSTVALVYNGTINSIPYSVSGNSVIAQGDIIIPVITSDVNVTFYWNITLDDGSVISTRSNNQSISTISIDDCSSYTNLIYNFSQYDEENQTLLGPNNTIELQVNLYDTSKTLLLVNFSQTFTDTNPVQICLEDALLTTVNYTSYTIVKYSANLTGVNESYSTEYYNILNQTIGNTTIPKDIKLYSLKQADTTPFRLTFRDGSYVLAPNILVQVWRQYIADNDFKIVEIPLTDSNGQTVLNLVRNDVVYNFIMVNESGDVVGTFNSVTAFCQDFSIGQCTINLAPDSLSAPIYDYEEEFDISISSPSYSNITKRISISFVTGDLTPKTVNMQVVRNNDFGNRSVCSDELTAASGTLSCNVSSITDTDQFLFIQTNVDGSLAKQDTINLNASTLNFGILNGAFYAFLLILTLICLFMEDRMVLTASLGLGWAVVISLGLVNGKLVGFGSAGIWILISIAIFLWKLNGEETL